MRSLFLFLVVNGLIAAGVVYLPEHVHRVTNGTTNGNLLLVGEDQSYDLLVLGSSHGRAMSRGKNHEIFERALDRKVLNLSKGGGCGGPLPARLYLEFFRRRGNDARTVLYFIDPWVMYSPHWNEGCNLFVDEPLRVDFLRRSFAAGIGVRPLVDYVTSKLRPSWLFQSPLPEEADLRVVTRLPSAKGLYEKAYPSGRSPEIFARYAEEVRRIADIARLARTDLVFVLPPTLLGKIPGREELVSLLRELAREGAARWYDFSFAVTDRKLFADADHLNSEGVRWFAREVLDIALSRGRDFRARRMPAVRATGRRTS